MLLTDHGFLQSPVLAFYFSAHWCPPCRTFTPELKEFYNAVSKSGKQLEIVFCSFDKSDDEAIEYINESHGDWLYLLPNDPKVE